MFMEEGARVLPVPFATTRYVSSSPFTSMMKGRHYSTV